MSGGKRRAETSVQMSLLNRRLSGNCWKAFRVDVIGRPASGSFFFVACYRQRTCVGYAV